ncbi:AMP-binding protein, partial [Streptomyces platensis]|uniref:non-ribosomal peptide synthetase n=1 Tax=Streptomyces platensis TaxID=58346 RepID=UPI0033D8F7C4
RPHPPIPSYQGDTVSFEWSAQLHARLEDLARDCGASLFMVVHTALVTLLSRLGAGEDIPIGAAVAGRTDQALDDLVGFFVNTLVLRTDVSGDPTFRELVERVRQRSLDAYAHQDVPFEHLVEVLNPERSLAHQPLFQVMLAWQNAERADLSLPGLSAEVVPAGTGTARMDLLFSLSEIVGSGGVQGAVEFNTDVFEPQTVQSLLTRLERLLEAVTADPEVRVGAVELLEPSERERLLVEFNAPIAGIGASGAGASAIGIVDGDAVSVPELFARQVERVPDAVAVVCGDEVLSYAELDAASNRLARLLIAEGVGPEQLVALALPRSVEMVVAVLAVLKAGGAYLPIDPEYPVERAEFILQDAEPVLALTTSALRSLFDGRVSRVVDYDAFETAQRVAVQGPGPVTDADRTQPLAVLNSAYVIYTSGSTGIPKGVAVPHAGVEYLVATQNESLGLSGRSRVLQFASPSFDAAFWELCMALGSGAALVVPEGRGLLAGEELAEAVDRFGVTHTLLTPSALAAVPAGQLSTVTHLLVGGEACSGELAARWAVGRQMINAYGPTESTVCAAMSSPLSGADSVAPIGRPVAGASVFVLDGGLRPVPVGVAGELYV